MSLEAFRWYDLVQVCTELGIDLGQRKRKPHIIKLLQAVDVSVEEFTEALEEIRGREQEAREREQEVREEERRKRADEKALETARWELEKSEYKREMERLDYEFEQLELAKKAREVECLRRQTPGVEGVTGKACQGKEKVGAGDTGMTGDQRLSPDTAVTVLRKPDPNSERRDGESDVEAATEVVCQEKRKMEAGVTEVTANQHVSSDATDAVPRKTDAVPHKIYPTAKLQEAESDRDPGKEEKALRASSGGFPDDEGDAKTEATPGKFIQLMESSAEMPEKAVQQSR
ncbi:caldesmon-like [Ixodes scapularis]|uniref:caldesmon-like n=1 Tax=Ixodes scapularis TaxID=6945 RepID=UPI001A9CF472|nr:caldesmon-like [Ixodes scapularis]